MFVVYDKDSRHIFLEFQITNLKLRIISIHQIRQIHKKSFLATKVTPCIRACALIGAGCRQKAQKKSTVLNVLLMCSMCFLWQILSLSPGLVTPFLQFHPFSLILLFFTLIVSCMLSVESCQSASLAPHISILVTTPWSLFAGSL